MSHLDLFFGFDGEPIDTLTWAKMYEDKESRFFFRDPIPEGHLVTVWHGVDPNYCSERERRLLGERSEQVFPHRVPKIFGTATVRPGDITELCQWTSLHNAELGHRWLLRHLTKVDA